MLGLSYISFLYKSTNEHGVHSPFVYDLLTKGIYSKNKTTNNSNIILKNKKANALWHKIADYLQFKNNDAVTLDYIFIQPKEALETQLQFGESNCCFIFKNPYKNREQLNKWKQLVQNTQLHVTIDLYYLGLAFKRPQQQKEHFVLAPSKTISAFLFEKLKV